MTRPHRTDGRIAALEAEVERQASALRRFGLMFGNICRDLGLEPNEGDADIAAAIEALRAEVEQLRRERGEARVAACRLLTYGQALSTARSHEDIMRARDAWRGIVQAVRRKHAWSS